ncbi:MAG: ABC transporter permease subunit [Deltaproteobacteria bacterium]|nr:ABC transporter permease subunit [Deltaproteobacteria bacterium]
MGNTLAIAKKELRIYFTTATSYVLLTAFAAITAYFFVVLVGAYAAQTTQFMGMQAQQMLERMNFNDQVILPLFFNIYVFFLILLPMVTMRLIAEEKRTKTMQLLMTTPVRPIEIVLGKYIAASTLIFVMLAITMVYPLILQIYGASTGDAAPIDWATVLCGYLGMFLLGAAVIAFGLFASSVTDSQIVAVLVSFAVLILFWMIGWAGYGQQGFVADLTANLSLINHLESFTRGILKVSDLVYYVSVIALGLFLTHRAVEAERWN